MKTQRILDGLFALAVLIYGAVRTYSSISYKITWYTGTTLNFILGLAPWLAAVIIIVGIHATYALTSLKRTKFSITTLILLIVWPIILLGIMKKMGVIENEGLAFLLGGALVIGEGIIILLHLAAFVRDCILARKDKTRKK